MHARQETHPDGPPHRLADAPLVDAAQARLAPMPQPAHGAHVLEHHVRVLELVERVDAEHVEDVLPLSPFLGGGGGGLGVDAGHRETALAPFVLLGAGEIVRGVDVAGAEAAEDLAFEVGVAVSGFGFGGGGAADAFALVVGVVVAGDARDKGADGSVTGLRCRHGVWEAG